MLVFDVLTLFPETFVSPLKESILGIALSKGFIEVNIHNLRDFTRDKHKTVDDCPYGGGAGMILKCEPVIRAVRELTIGNNTKIILLTPQGVPYKQKYAFELLNEKRILLICGHYKGFDERIIEILKPDEISIGDFILSGGEIPALVIIDSITRLIPGVLGNIDSALGDSFTEGMLDCPQYTRPLAFENLNVPEILTSGNHELIRRWRLKESLRQTVIKRPDLIEKIKMKQELRKILEEILDETKEQ